MLLWMILSSSSWAVVGPRCAYALALLLLAGRLGLQTEDAIDSVEYIMALSGKINGRS